MIKILMVSCKEATRLTEKKLLEGKLSWLKERQLKLHFKVCDACKRYAEQSAILEDVFRMLLERHTDQAGHNFQNELASLSPEVKEAILISLKNRF